jgi:16S rRNA (guanine966-N2)-methyltransferase
MNMRIISGSYKGKKLFLPDPTITRPLRDYVKESLFNLLTHSKLTNFNLVNSNILDVFSGSGSFGIECLSRGAAKVIFIEKEKKTFAILNKNIQNLSLEQQCTLLNKNILNFDFRKLLEPSVDLLFLDPPFQFNFLNELFNLLKENSDKIAKSLIIIHFENKNFFKFDNYLDILIQKKYGRSIIIFGKIKNI